MLVMHCASVNCSQEREHNTNENMLELKVGGRFRYFISGISGRFFGALRALTFALIHIHFPRFRLLSLLSMFPV